MILQMICGCYSRQRLSNIALVAKIIFCNDHEDQPEERLNVLFRAFHSLKSLASSMGCKTWWGWHTLVRTSWCCPEQSNFDYARNKNGANRLLILYVTVILTVAQRKPAIVDGVVNCLEKLKKIIVVTKSQMVWIILRQQSQQLLMPA